MTEEIIGRIAKFRELVVVAAPQESDTPPLEPNSERYVLDGSVRLENGKARLMAKVVRGGSVVWANIYDDDLNVRALLEIQNDIANQVATAIARPYGVIFQADAARADATNAPDDWAAYSCTLSYYTYRANFDPKVADSVRACLEKSVARFPEYATAWALLSLMYVDKLRFRQNPDPANSSLLNRATVAARRAVELDPENIRSLQAQMMVLAFKSDVEAALKVGEHAVEINPNDAEFLGEYGARLAVAGEWARGAKFIAMAMDRNPSRSSLLEASLALCLYMQRDYRGAAVWIKRAEVPLHPHYHLFAAIIYGQLGDEAGAERERTWILVNAPGLVQNLRQELTMRSMKPEDQAHFAEGLQKAGIAVPGF